MICIVVASIFVLARVFTCVLFSFTGVEVDALASETDETLRPAKKCLKRTVSERYYPKVSNGNPNLGVLGYHHLNVYRVVGGRGGSETSQYPHGKSQLARK